MGTLENPFLVLIPLRGGVKVPTMEISSLLQLS